MRFSNIVLIMMCMAFFQGLAGYSTQAQQVQTSASAGLRAGRYDKAAEVSTSGTILSIQAQDNSKSMPRGVYLTIQSGPLTLNVHMGLFTANSIPFKAGDHVQVTGSLVNINGSQILLAKQVQSASQVLTVRSPNGFVLRFHPAIQTQGGQQ